MEEIDLKELLNYFVSKIFLMLSIVFVVLIIGFSYDAFIKVPKYKSYTTILLTTENNTITSNDIILNKNLIDTYTEIIKSRKVVGKVIDNLSLEYDIETLQKNIAVANVNDTEIIKITVADEDSNLAKNIANETAKVFNAEVIKLYNIQNIGIIDYAEASPKPYNINLIKSIAIYLMIGIILSLAVVFVMFYFDTTIKTVEEVERKLNIPVIGAIPVGGRKHEWITSL